MHPGIRAVTLSMFSSHYRRANFAKLTIPLNTPRPSRLGPGTLERNAVRNSRATPLRNQFHNLFNFD